MVSLKVGSGKSLSLEMMFSTIFYDSLLFQITDDNGEQVNYSLLPNRVSFKKNKILVDSKICMLQERYGHKINICNPPYSRSIFTPLLYAILFFKTLFTKIFIPSQWILAFKEKNTKKWSKIKFDNNELMADPFIYYYNSKYYVLYEALNYDTDKGYISIGTLDIQNKEIIDKHIIIEENYHLSYPFILKIDDDLYIIPESSYNNTIDLYKCIEFPYKWEKTRTLIDNISAVDTNLINKNGMWYLLTSEKRMGVSFGDELSLYVTDDPLSGIFLPIIGNPVVHDISKSRNAGEILNNIRVSQDCSKRYGYRVNFMEINELSENNYSERYVKSLKLPFGTIAMHTYNSAGNIEIVDLKIINISPYFLYRNLSRIIKKLKIKILK
ncbi:TPA: glucosamine inositolphosphorylceramide transferase family protein [Morganella morganii]